MAVIVYPWCNETVAHQRGVATAVNRVADRHAAIARGVLLAHRAEGHSQITVTRGRVDSFVNLNDERGDLAAAAIEYGARGGRGVRALHKAFGL